MFEFTTINSHDSSGYNKNQGTSNSTVKPESDFFSMILSHSNISPDKEPAAELSKPVNNIENYISKVENQENCKTENKEAAEITEKKYKTDGSDDKLKTQQKDTPSEKTGKAEEPEGKITDKKTEQKESAGKEEVKNDEDALVKKALNKEIINLLKSESPLGEISAKDIAGIVESLIASGGIKEAIKAAKEESSLKGNFKEFKTALSDNLKKVPDKIIEEILSANKGKDSKIALNPDDIKKILEKVLLQQSDKGKKENLALKNSNNQRHVVSGDVKFENQVLNGDKIKHALSEEEGGTGKKSFNEKGDSKEGFNFGYQKSDFSGKRISDMPELKGRSTEFRQSLQDIVDRARISVRDNKNGNFNVKLYPKELGSVNVNLTMENGVVTAKFFVDSDEAKNLLSQNMENLKDQLREAGIEVGEFHVGVNDQRERFLRDNDDRKKDLIQFPEGKEFLMAATEYDGNSPVINSNSINVII